MRFFLCLEFLLIAGLLQAQKIDKDTLTPVAINKCTSVKDQYMSSTCWSFAGNSFLESELARKGITDADLSEMFTARMAWQQKIELHLAYKGTNCLTPGGQFHNIQWVMNNFGLVPEQAFTGKANGEINHNHSLLDTAITRYMAKLVAEKKTKPDEDDWKYINAQFDKYLGKIPATFTADGRQYSAKSYQQSRLGIKADDYMEITSFTHHPWYKPFVFENKYNYSYDKYMNVPLTDFMAITDDALRNGYTVLWNGDVTDAGFDFNEGVAVLHNIKDAVAERQRTFADSSSYMDHMMHVVGVYADSKGHKWYYVKNSWGTGNLLNGYMLMDENYYKIKTAAIVVNKNAIPAPIRQKMK